MILSYRSNRTKASSPDELVAALGVTPTELLRLAQPAKRL
jgi:hypothetical protein